VIRSWTRELPAERSTRSAAGTSSRSRKPIPAALRLLAAIRVLTVAAVILAVLAGELMFLLHLHDPRWVRLGWWLVPAAAAALVIWVMIRIMVRGFEVVLELLIEPPPE
jgi:hypothetical protein